MDEQEETTKRIWLLSQSISQLLQHNRSKLEYDAQPIQIKDDLNLFKTIIEKNFPTEEVFKVALESIPENAVENGVYSEEDLVRRFNKVEKIGQQVALIPSAYSPIYVYAQSWLYSYIRPLKQIEFSSSPNYIRVKKIPDEEFNNTLPVNPKEWDTYDILQRVRFCVDNRNLEMALRYANQLSGEPRRVAKDWISDTREYLEVKQAIDLIQSKMASINLHQFNLAK